MSMLLTVGLPARIGSNSSQRIDEFTRALNDEMQDQVQDDSDEDAEDSEGRSTFAASTYSVCLIFDPQLNSLRQRLIDLMNVNFGCEDEIREIAELIGFKLPSVDAAACVSFNS